MAKKKNPLVFMDVSIDGDPVERMVFEGGDFVRRDGTSGESIYDGKFPDESPRLQHDGPGLLSMAIADRDTVGSQFVITFKANHDLDKYVVFGQLVQGNEVLKKMENVGNEEGIPTVTVKIINCGEVSEDNMKNKFRTGNDTFSAANNYESRRKGKNKKSSRDKRKNRRRHYSSDSESSSDSETESSESDSDSDSYLSSSSDISSSSDDGHKKRKRSSKRGKYRHGKRRDRRLMSRSRSASPKRTMIGNQSPLATEKALPHRKNEEADLECDAPRENGGRKSNGIEEGAKSDRSAERPPDVVDDGPSKSRSPVASRNPPRFLERSLSRSPARSIRISPSRTRKDRSISRGPVRGHSRRSISRSPVRSLLRSRRSPTRSPLKSTRKSISRSPVRLSKRSTSRSPARSRRSISGSPVRSSRRSISRSSARAPPRRSISRSPLREPIRNYRRSYSRSPTAVRRVRSPTDRGRNMSRSVSPDESAKRIRRGRGFSERYSYARRYRTPSPDRSPVRSYRYGGRIDRERRYSPRRYRSPPRRTPPRSEALWSLVGIEAEEAGQEVCLYHRARVDSPRVGRRSSPSPSRSRSESRSLLNSQSSPKQVSKVKSRSSSGSPDGRRGLVSYDDGSPDSGR
ncbi:hypothetical protein GOBAR_AA24903 [Gossypium barbadense]|uniref:PPIase cyclophilin-type domain-containing protein n=1 Tax=Gossypium barbadense TaxID=3634 RepID=A0A2P5WXE3_GOSBA|nr:hypothetical protein GOBAR_AA24903 [Gossypium barbadense]